MIYVTSLAVTLMKTDSGTILPRAKVSRQKQMTKGCFYGLYGVIVTSYVTFCTYFGMYGKTHSCAICYQYNFSGGSVFKFKVAIPSLDKLCYRKRFGKTRVKHVIGLNEGGQDHRLIAKQKQNKNKQTSKQTKNRTDQSRKEQNGSKQIKTKTTNKNN